ncbi:FAD-dependent oxidoreductase [Dinoroseobacter sp. PD6]|uniref:flavin monoamine oxidase family protein n=1 Tax=Dinoroseobacter sp. PD6 TaxID=3028384 RepID=UPI00237BFAFD|nr:FAD-dependent oxidoreductase [Dinoroseobacter sp. PD6]MDD9718990.1 FAD-dependent oxidoreductase [Dinoroseobacter sp. PD6]
MQDDPRFQMSRRDLLQLIGVAGGASAMMGAMTTMGHSLPSPYDGPPALEGAPQGEKALVLGAGLAGMVAAYELRRAGYEVEILEYQSRAGGRCWTLKGGDSFRELGGYEQTCNFSQGQYINIGPWRIPHHHRAVLDYCQRLGVELEIFVQEDQNAFLHSPNAFGGKPQRYHNIWADYVGGITEMLAKSVNQGAFADQITTEDAEMLLESLKSFGVLDSQYRYTERLEVSSYRGYPNSGAPGGGLLDAAPTPEKPIELKDILDSRFWQYLRNHTTYRHHAPMFQPKGGMEEIAHAFEREVGDLITHNARVTRIMQDSAGVTVEWSETGADGKDHRSTGDWCVCTIPFTVLSQIEIDVAADMRAAMRELHYHESVKAGFEMKRRFWEQDLAIYGGITLTDLPIAEIGYPSNEMHSTGPGVLLAAYVYGPQAYAYNSMSPEERIESIRNQLEIIHPQAAEEFSSGVALSWHRVPWMLGCYSNWDTRDESYRAAARVDRRIVCAGEHLSYLPGWQEGSILSSLDAIRRLNDVAASGLYSTQGGNQ